MAAQENQDGANAGVLILGADNTLDQNSYLIYCPAENEACGAGTLTQAATPSTLLNYLDYYVSNANPIDQTFTFAGTPGGIDFIWGFSRLCDTGNPSDIVIIPGQMPNLFIFSNVASYDLQYYQTPTYVPPTPTPTSTSTADFVCVSLLC